MKTRIENISVIKGLFGLDKDMLNDSIGYFGNSYDNYTDEQLERFRLISEDLESWYEEQRNYEE